MEETVKAMNSCKRQERALRKRIAIQESMLKRDDIGAMLSCGAEKEGRTYLNLSIQLKEKVLQLTIAHDKFLLSEKLKDIQAIDREWKGTKWDY